MRRIVGLSTLLVLLWCGAAVAKEFEFQWNDAPSGEEIEGYRLYYAIGSPDNYALLADIPDTSGSTTTAAYDLPEQTVYYFALTAYNDVGESSYSNVACNYWRPTIQSPANGATGVARTVVLDWSRPEEGDAYEYEILYGTSPDDLTSLAALTGSSLLRAPKISSQGVAGLSVAVTALLLFGFMGGPVRRRSLAAITLAVVVAAGCSGGGGDGGDGSSNSSTSAQPSNTLTDLSAETTYYWKVVAVAPGGIVTESDTQSFTTGN